MSKVTVIDIGEAVFHYLISLDDVDDRVLELVEFLNDGGTIGRVLIEPSWSIAACGHGRFMFEVQISIPEQFDHTEYRLIDRKVFLFSSSIGAIVWSYQNNLSDMIEEPRRIRAMTVACLRRPISDSQPKPMCMFAVGGGQYGEILVGEIEPCGTIQFVKTLTLVRYNWHSLMILSPTHVITAENMQGRDRSRRTVTVTFYDKNGICDPSCVENMEQYNSTELVLTGELEVLDLSLLRGSYVALVCCMYKSSGTFSVHENANDEGEDLETSLWIVVVHIPSETEVCRTELLSNWTRNHYDGVRIKVPFLPSDINDTVGLCLSSAGVVMTGQDVRNTIELSTNNSIPKQKKKSHLRNNSGYKKDGLRLGKK
jgi:hypothetical protein